MAELFFGVTSSVRFMAEAPSTLDFFAPKSQPIFARLAPLLLQRKWLRGRIVRLHSLDGITRLRNFIIVIGIAVSVIFSQGRLAKTKHALNRLYEDFGFRDCPCGSRWLDFDSCVVRLYPK